MTKLDLPDRKSIRLSGYDYSQNGAYFVTICTRDRAPLLGNITVGAAVHSRPNIALSHFGEIADKYIKGINGNYPNVSVSTFCIMPNHVHLIITIEGPPRAAAPTTSIPRIINTLKSLATKAAGLPLWQRGYYEHIIHGEKEFQEIWKYIEDNSNKWAEDKYYRE